MPLFAFVQGERAFLRGVARTECPYPEDERLGAEWLAGWDAEEDAANHYAEVALRREQLERLEPWRKNSQT